MRILLGVDDSKFAGDALRAIITQFRTENTEVRVLHVLQPITLLAPPEMAPGYMPEIGDVRMCIIDAAAEWGADLIVVGSHGQRGIRGFLLGSVAESVARHAKCSVEIVRAPVRA